MNCGRAMCGSRPWPAFSSGMVSPDLQQKAWTMRSARPWQKTIGVSVLGVDTNVLVRFLTEDDPVQSPQAVRLVTDKANQPIFISLGVLVETYLVLARVKKLPRADLYPVLAMILGSQGFVLERADLVSRALTEAVDGNFDFT